MNAKTSKPRIRIHSPAASIKAHRLVMVIPAVLSTIRQPSQTDGYGTAAGYTRICLCGYQTRSGAQFAKHLETENLMTEILSFLNEPGESRMRHYLIDTAHSKSGTIYICSCGRDFPSLTIMQEHIRVMHELSQPS